MRVWTYGDESDAADDTEDAAEQGYRAVVANDQHTDLKMRMRLSQNVIGGLSLPIYGNRIT